eukprot:m.483392 g.483392  ORF g.483392 m.483392 type:complete len:966 (-) comp22924_c0_seq1:281-3178(-)
MTDVRVVARFRPQQQREIIQGGAPIARFDGSGRNVTIQGQRKAAFTFDKVFDETSTQEDVYDYAAKPIVEDLLKGYNGTIFAYGQTSSGKTHTMEGPDISGPQRGMIPRIVFNVFQYIEVAPESFDFSVRVSYFEIYNEKIRDLLCDGNDNLQIHESRDRGVYVRHATELYMQDPEEVLEVMASGAQRRSVASTGMNDVSSRSHSVFLMEVTQKDTVKGGVKAGKLYLVDLAGSEKVSKTGADGEVLVEAKNINKSLSALGLVIMSLTDGQARNHVPYRDSKLTRILQESLGGNSRTTIVICASPSSYNEAETLSSLRFGQRAKKIKNNARVNVQYSAEELTKRLDKAKKEIAKLNKRLLEAEKELAVWRSGGTVSEEDRVAMSAGEAASSEQPEAVAAVPDAAAPGISEQEREEWVARESELLEILDERDQHIRALKREMEVLEQDKVTIAKLAAENDSQRRQVRDLEGKLDEASAENQEYEIAIEDMAHINSDLEEQNLCLKTEKSKAEEDVRAAAAKFASQTDAIADMVASLCAAKPTTVPDSGTVVDAQVSKARAFVAQIQAEVEEQKQRLAESLGSKDEIETSLQDKQRELAAAQLTASQLEAKLSSTTDKVAKYETEIKQVREDRDELRLQLSKLTDELAAAEEAAQLAQTSAGEGEAQVAEIRETLERQRQLQREQHASQIKDLEEQVEELEAANTKLEGERDQLQVEVVQLQADLDKRSTDIAKQEEKMQEITKKAEQKEKIERETQGIAQATKQQLQSYDALKDKMRSQLLERCQRALGHAKGQAKDPSGASEQHSTHVAYLEKTNRELNSQHQDLMKQNAQHQREMAVLQKQLALRSERIKNLEVLMKDSEERLQKQYKKFAHEMERMKYQRQSNNRMVVRRKSNRSLKETTVNRAVIQRSDSDAAKAGFWNDQIKASRSSRSDAASVHSSLGPRKPAAAPAAAADPDPLSIEYV